MTVPPSYLHRQILEVRVTQHFRNKFTFIKKLLEDMEDVDEHGEGGWSHTLAKGPSVTGSKGHLWG